MCKPSGIPPRIQIHRYEHEEKFQAKSKQPIAQIKKPIKKSTGSGTVTSFFGIELNRIIFQIRLIIHRPLILHLNPKTSHIPLPLLKNDECARISNYAHFCICFDITHCGL